MRGELSGSEEVDGFEPEGAEGGVRIRMCGYDPQTLRARA